VLQWLEKTQIVYNAKAQEAGIYVLEACGFDSIPAEMGLLYSKRQFDGVIYWYTLIATASTDNTITATSCFV